LINFSPFSKVFGLEVRKSGAPFEDGFIGAFCRYALLAFKLISISQEGGMNEQ